MSGGLGLAPRALVIDVPATKHRAVVEFWAEALGATPRWPDDDSEPYVPLEGPRSVLEVLVQRSEAVPRFHIDLPASDRHGIADQLVAAGATRAQRFGDHWIMRDPAGLLFCLIDDDVHVAPVAERDPSRVHLDALFIDAPGQLVEPQLAFWSHALGAEVRSTSRPETFTELAGVKGPGGDLLVEVQRLRDGASRFHVDLSTDAVEEEAARLEALGATRVGQVETWTTFADPAGNLFCVVPR